MHPRVITLLCALALPGPALASKDIAHVFGWVEQARLIAGDVIVNAKLDSGALTSSLHATDIERFKRNGEKWVRFTVAIDKDDDGKAGFRKTFERRLYRDVRIRGAGGTSQRPVVLMRVCLGNVIHEQQFSLRDRSGMHYPMLLGRRTIQHLGLLDVTRTFMNEPDCRDPTEIRLHGDQLADPDIGDGAGDNVD